MKALIISDVHSNVLALEAIWAQERDSDVIYCAGDLVDYGVFPRETLDWVRAHGAICVQGNHDAWVLVGLPDAAGISDEEREWRHHNGLLLRPEDIAFLGGLPQAIAFDLDGARYGMTHLFRDYETIVSLHAFHTFCAARFPDHAERPVERLILGHTHRRAIHKLSDRFLWMNPGSASYRRPDDPDQDAHYITITDGRIALRRARYDVRPLYDAVQRLRLAERELAVARWFFGPREPTAPLLD